MTVSPKSSTSVFGMRLRQARLMKNLPQDQLGVLAGLDEGTASTRISRYESGIHEPPLSFAEKLAKVLHIPVAFFYTRDEVMAKLILELGQLPKPAQQKLLSHLTKTK